MAQDKKKKDPILVAFAAKVRNRRYFLSLTQEQLAERVDFHVNYIGGIERAERNPSLTSLVALAKGLECAIKDLVPDGKSQKS
ncbi:MAG: helix-turn-helix transcriptional regulator [Chlamydiota bacterium]